MSYSIQQAERDDNGHEGVTTWFDVDGERYGVHSGGNVLDVDGTPIDAGNMPADLRRDLLARAEASADGAPTSPDILAELDGRPVELIRDNGEAGGKRRTLWRIGVPGQTYDVIETNGDSLWAEAMDGTEWAAALAECGVPGPGRPHRTAAAKATPLQIRVDADERAEIQRRAEVAGLSISEYVRRRALGLRTPAA